MRTPRVLLAVCLFAAVLVAPVLLVTPAAAQTGPGWIYVDRGGEIIAVRPDGSDPRNLSNSPDRYDSDPDVQMHSGVELFHTFQEILPAGNPSTMGGIRYVVLVDEGQDFDNIDGLQDAAVLSPSWGYDASRLYFSGRAQQIDAILDRFAPAISTVVENNGGANGYRDPDGTPSETIRDEVLYTITSGGIDPAATSRLGGLRLRNFGSTPADTLIAAGKYTAAGMGRWFPDASRVIFSCRVSDGGPLQVCLSAPDQDGTGFTALPTSVNAANPAVSPDLTRIAYRGTDGSVWVANIDGSSPTQIMGPTADPQFGLDWGQEINLRGGTPPEEMPPPPPVDPAPNTPLPPGGTDGNPATTDRAEFSSPGPYSAAVSQARYPSSGFSGGQARPQYVVLGRDDNFADSLAGSPLTARGPLLFTPQAALSQTAADEMSRLLPASGTVYLLGGTAALSAEVEQAVSALGLTPMRLAGPSRFETAVEIAREVVGLGGSTDEVVVARGNGPADNPTAAWADSVTGGVYAATAFVPVVVTPIDAIHPALQAFIDETGATATLLGGTSALSQGVQDGLPGSRRIAGDSRADTAGQIATQLLGFDVEAPRSVLLFDGFSENGWQFGLAGAGLAADLGASLLMAQADGLPSQTAALISSCGDAQVETLILGWEGVISAGVADTVDALDGSACP